MHEILVEAVPGLRQHFLGLSPPFRRSPRHLEGAKRLICAGLPPQKTINFSFGSRSGKGLV
jgi:hypothetical protein